MDSSVLSLKWNNHVSAFRHLLQSLKEKDLYSDVTLACDGKFFFAHKFVLSTCSEYFQQMFEKTPCKQPIIVLKDTAPNDLEALLNYMYLGEVNVPQSDLSSLIKAAESLRILGLAVPDEAPTKTSKELSNKRSHSDKEHSSSSKKTKRDCSSHSHEQSSRNQISDSGHKNFSSTPKKDSYASHLPPLHEDHQFTIKREVFDSAEEEAETTIKSENDDFDMKQTNFEAGTSTIQSQAPLTSWGSDNSESNVVGEFTDETFDSPDNFIPEDPEMVPICQRDFFVANQEPNSSNSGYSNYSSGENDNCPTARSDHLEGHLQTMQPASAAAASRKCPHCPFLTKHYSSLHRHLKSHLKNVPYKCEYCSYCTSHSSNFSRHLKLVHAIL